jgi:hypothetical protein
VEELRGNPSGRKISGVNLQGDALGRNLQWASVIGPLQWDFFKGTTSVELNQAAPNSKHL